MSPARVPIAVVNKSSRLSDEQVVRGIEALQKQVSEDFAPVWHVDAQLSLVSSEEVKQHLQEPDRFRPPDPRWALVLLDSEPDDPRLLGYHDLTRSGLPLSKVLLDRIPEDEDWTHAASHELLEMLADPDINAVTYRHPDATTEYFYAREVCDPVAPYRYGYAIDGRWVTNFVWPSWFQPGSSHRESARFDERQRTSLPFEILQGGYIAVFDTQIAAWLLLTPDGPEIGDEPGQLGSRVERRSTADNRWMASDMSTAP